jgi:hypothetical protein
MPFTIVGEIQRRKMNNLKHELFEPFIHPGSRRNFMSAAGKVASVAAIATAGIAQSIGTEKGSTGTGADFAVAAVKKAGDINILNYLLTLEFLEATFYSQFLGHGALPAGATSFAGLVGPVMGDPPSFSPGAVSSASALSGFQSVFAQAVYTLLTQIRDHEVAHVYSLITTIRRLGGTPVQPCTYTFPALDINSLLLAFQDLENTRVSAYAGVLNLFTNPALIESCATIASVEARHAAFMNLIVGGGLSTGVFTDAGSVSTGAPPIPGASPSPFPSAFDTPLPMTAVLPGIGMFLVSCPTAVGDLSERNR